MNPKWLAPKAESAEEDRWRKLRANQACSALPRHADERTDHGRYLSSTHWRLFRWNVMYVSACKCARCGAHASDVHHLTYARLGHELLTDVEPLCRRCHERAHPEADTLANELVRSIGRLLDRAESATRTTPGAAK